MRWILLIAAALLFAQAAEPMAAPLRPVYDKPIYNPESKSYFELVDGRHIHGQGPTWEQARNMAAERSFGGVQGRLAIIRSPETDMFIRINLRPNQHTWFGLHYDCKQKRLLWTDGTELKKGDYANWNPRGWYASPQWGFCVGDYLMPAYLPLHSGERHWMMQRSPKRYYTFIVEYPTGGPVSDTEATRGHAVPTAPQATPQAAAKPNTDGAATAANGEAAQAEQIEPAPGEDAAPDPAPAADSAE